MAASILIDGRSGSGKTEFASALAAGWPQVQLVRLDDLYPGWDGLDAGSAAVEVLLIEHRWQRWDWAHSRPAEWHDIDPARPLLVEGCGALSARTRPLASFAFWVELDDATRKLRALERDGDAYLGHWESWAAQELAFIDREHPQSFADAVIDGTDVALAAAAWLPVVRAL